MSGCARGIASACARLPTVCLSSFLSKTAEPSVAPEGRQPRDGEVNALCVSAGLLLAVLLSCLLSANSVTISMLSGVEGRAEGDTPRPSSAMLHDFSPACCKGCQLPRQRGLGFIILAELDLKIFLRKLLKSRCITTRYIHFKKINLTSTF